MVSTDELRFALGEVIIESFLHEIIKARKIIMRKCRGFIGIKNK
jgi:hypothetical protein